MAVCSTRSTITHHSTYQLLLYQHAVINNPTWTRAREVLANIGGLLLVESALINPQKRYVDGRYVWRKVARPCAFGTVPKNSR